MLAIPLAAAAAVGHVADSFFVLPIPAAALAIWLLANLRKAWAVAP